MELRTELGRGLRWILLPPEDALAQPVDYSDDEAGVSGGIAAAEALEGAGDGELLRVAPTLRRLSQLRPAPRLEPELVLGDVGNAVGGRRHQVGQEPVCKLIGRLDRLQLVAKGRVAFHLTGRDVFERLAEQVIA